MSRKNYFQDPHENEPVLGVDTTSPLAQVKPGFVREAKNFRPGLSGGWVKRDGFTEVAITDWSTRDITAGIEYRISGADRLVLFGTKNTSTTGIVGYNNAGTMTAIATANPASSINLNGNERPSFVQFNDLCFFFNGIQTAWKYNGTAASTLGLPKPAVPTETSKSDEGGTKLTPGGDYVYFYTYYNNVTKAESTPSPSLTVDLGGTNNSLVIGLTADTSGNSTHIRLYRTVASGNVAFLHDSTILYSATTYTDEKPDSTLTTQLEWDNSQLEDLAATPNYPVVNDNRIFCMTDDNEGRFSKLGQSGPMPESFQATAFFRTDGSQGDKAIGLCKAGETTVVLKRHSLGALRRIGFQDFASSVDSIQYQYEELVTGLEPVSHFGVAEVFGEAIILCRDNIYGTRGTKGDIRALANPIQATIRALGFTDSQLEQVSAVNDSGLRMVKFQVFEDETKTEPAFTICGDYNQYPDFRWFFYTEGTNSTTHPGIRAGCFVPVTNATAGSQDIYFGNIDANGEIYLMENGTNDNGSAIYGRLVDRPRDGQLALADKLFKKATIFAQGDGDDYNLTVKSMYDLAATETESTTLSLYGGGGIWDVAYWGVGVWSDPYVAPLEYNVHRKAKHQQLIFEQTEVDAPVTLYNWATAGSMFKFF